MSPKRHRGNPGLTRSLILAVLLALLPLLVLSILQALAARSYADDLIRERLLASTAASGSDQRDSFRMIQRMIRFYRNDPDVLNITPRCSEVLRSPLRGGTRGPVANLIRWDARGTMVCSALPMPVRPVKPTIPEWYEAARTGRFTISAPFNSVFNGERVISAIQPLKDRGGRFAGSITATVDISWLEEGLRRGRLSSDAQAIIVDQTGKPLFGSGTIPAQRFPIAPALGKINQVRGTAPWLYSVAPLVEGRLYLVYAEPQLPIFATTRTHLYVSLVLPVLAVVLGCLALWVAVRRLVLRWLRELTGIADALREGRHPAENDIFDSAPYELAQLNDDMRGMANAIEARDDRLIAAAERNLALAREVNHRVKNNLQIVASLIAMQKSNLSDGEARQALDQTKARVAGIGLIHQLLYDGLPGQLGQVDMQDLMDGLCGLLHGDIGRAGIELDCHTTGGSVPIDQAVPLTLFIIEGVTNAYRHAFPHGRSGSITLTLSRVGGDITVVIEDNGVGYSEPADTPAKTTGQTLMQAYAVQLHGTFAAKAVRDKGVRMELRFAVLQGEGDARAPAQDG